MSITQTSEYIGRFKLSVNSKTEDKLQDFIDYYERTTLIALMGKELYDLFIADLDPITGIPVTQRFIDIYDEIYLDENTCFDYQRISEGIPEMLKNFVWFEYTRKQNQKSSINGTVRPTGENSTSIPNQNSYIVEYYNKGIFSYRTIAEFIRKDLTIYPEYKGVLKEFVTPFG